MKKLLVVALVLFCALPLMAQQRGGDYVDGEVEVVDARLTVAPQGRQWAVFIGIDQYLYWDPENPLKYPKKDAEEIRDILLENYDIDLSCVRELYNIQATREGIIRLFIELGNKTEPNDSVFVFHAGHGVSDPNTKTSAWIPYDGGEDKIAQSNWIHHFQILNMLSSLNARHVFLISDSCFSGDLLEVRGDPVAIRNYPAAYDRISRQVMTSGASGEEVADVSEFAARLKDTLLRTKLPYVTPDYLLSQIKDVPTGRELYTIPNLGTIQPHRIGGSFLFFNKNPESVMDVGGNRINDPPLPPPPPVKAEPGTREYFIGSWVGYPETENSMSLDEYEINFLADGRCNIKITNDLTQQETTGRWYWENSFLRITAPFRNPSIAYQPVIDWSPSIVRFNGDTGFNMFGKAATNGSPVRFTFYRNN